MIRLDIDYRVILGALVLVVLVFLGVLYRIRRVRNIKIRDASLSVEELVEHAKSMSLEHSVVPQRSKRNWPISRMNDNFKYIQQTYMELNAEVTKKNSVPPAAEWLLDNFYVLEEQVNGLRRNMSKKSYFELPVLRKGPYQNVTRISVLMMELVSHTQGRIEEEVLLQYLEAYQSHNVLLEREIYAMPAMLKLALLENIRMICEDIIETKKQWNLADEMVEEWALLDHMTSDEISALFEKGNKAVSSMIETPNSSFVEHLFYRLRRSGKSYSDVLRYIDGVLGRFDTSAELLAQKEHNAQAISTVGIGNCIISLKYLSGMNWTELFDAASNLEKILAQDPDGTYSRMDIQSRFYYKNTVEHIAKMFGVSELYIGKEALYLARRAFSSENAASADSDNMNHTWHIGYYIIGDGLSLLEERQEREIKYFTRIRRRFVESQGAIYMLSIVSFTILLTLMVVSYSRTHADSNDILIMVLTAIAVIIPVSDIVISIANWIVNRVKKPAVFPRLELKEGVPDSMRTIVVIPAIIPDRKRVRELMENMENHYLGNREKNVFFALIGAFKDSDYETIDSDESIIEEASLRIMELNGKYSNGEKDIFYFYNRDRILNEIDQTWTGWERKRGALMEFNELLLGSTDTSFSYSSNKFLPDNDIRYVITLDADTVLPLGMAKKMIGTMAHPLNSPVIDKEKGIVTKGYGLMQPRISFDSDSSNRSVFSRIYTGQEGLDPYASAISDVYQDLFGEGIFTGKGIYDLRVFQTVLKGTLPENAILSHDLLEGSFVRAALVSDLELIDSYPSKYNSFMARLHRWIRGDWQLVPWLFRSLHTMDHSTISNPLSVVSKWKIIDNLRRSLMAPSVMFLFIVGFTLLPGSGVFWFSLGILALGTPLGLSLMARIFREGLRPDTIKRYLPGFFGIKASVFQFLLSIMLLPYQAVKAVNAITVTLARVFFTKKNLLEWVTSSDADKAQPNSLESYIRSMGASATSGLIIVILTYYFKPENLFLSSLLAVVWLSSPVIAYLISRDENNKLTRLNNEALLELRKTSRKTWRYFEEFSNAGNHDLAPDNFQEEPYRGIAHKTSPTNIGLGLMASLTARDMGYIGLKEAIERISKTITTIEKMEKWNGHLYNWYDTRTLKPMRPMYVSTVDSGNLVCYLITLIEGLQDYMEKPLLDSSYARGITDTVIAGMEEHRELPQAVLTISSFEKQEVIEPTAWFRALKRFTEISHQSESSRKEWALKLRHQGDSLLKEMELFMPWVMASSLSNSQVTHVEMNPVFAKLMVLIGTNTPLHDLPELGKRIVDCCDQLLDELCESDLESMEGILDWLNEVKEAAIKSIQFTTEFIERYEKLILRISELSEGTMFKSLYSERRHLFYIGYNVEEMRLTNSYYDLLASEARQTSYLAIARGEVPPTHWFMLGRSLTVVDRFKGLVSWSGTMFEYLMPLLIMRSYKNTLLDETYSFAVKSQIKYGKQRQVPWGSSESAFGVIDINLDYQYKAIGVPWLGLKRGLAEDNVIAPYATVLALLVFPEEAYKNLTHLKAEGMEGSYGYYEALDYTLDHLEPGAHKKIIRSYMAHHQGMSLMALNNYLNDDIMQKRFGVNPFVKSARLLLQEKVPQNFIFTKGSKEKIPVSKVKIYNEEISYREFSSPDFDLPKVHILSNGNYFVGLTDQGTGYSRTKDVDISRWREDPITENYGTFFYLKNIETDQVWSSAYAPLNKTPEKYEVIFTADKASYKRTDGEIETLTEIVVGSGDNAEVRRLKLKNNGGSPCIIQLTSYIELVGASHGSDVAHPAFSNLFIRTEYDHEHKVLLANRRRRSEQDRKLWIASIPVIEGETVSEIEYETDRLKFIGRNHHTGNPEVIERGKPLSNTVGSVLDPIFSLRTSIRIKPGEMARIFFVTVTAESREALMELVVKYGNAEACDASFRFALTRSQVEAKYLNIKAHDMELYQDMISDILFISPRRRIYEEKIKSSHLGQPTFWRYGISGDRPMVLLTMDKTDDVELLHELLKAHEYWRVKDLKVDLVILCKEEYSYINPLYALITEAVYSTQTQDFMNLHRDVFILKSSDMTSEEIDFFYANARMIFEGSRGKMRKQYSSFIMKALGEKSTSTTELGNRTEVRNSRKFQNEIPMLVSNFETEDHEELLFYNGLGGFGENGKSYVIRLEHGKRTPLPWVNVIANPNFGFIVSESGGGYTWSDNSREFKISKWSNDAVGDEPSEIFYIGDESGNLWSGASLPIREEEPYTIEHGFGYSKFLHKSHGLDQELVQFVPVNDPVKISMLRFQNENLTPKIITVTFYMKPLLGVSTEETEMHLVSSQTSGGSLLIENPYNREFAGKVCFIDTSHEDRTVTGDRKEFFGRGGILSPDALVSPGLSGETGAGFNPCGAMQIEIRLEPKETKEFVFVMGIGNNREQADELAVKYKNLLNAKEALDQVKSFWHEKLGAIEVSTPDSAMNIMLNGWLQYQVISCRLYARSGFYQAGGAYGFRDQLQDTLALAATWPAIAKEQIIRHAGHQFEEGDVLHWWHEPSGKGTRTRISDDFLWLPYVTAEYISITGDFGILDSMAPYLEEDPLEDHENERYCQPRISTDKYSLYDHCLRALKNAMRFGVHKLPLMRSGDWNDGMNNIGIDGKGESVWLGWFLFDTLQKFIPIAREMGDALIADEFTHIAADLKDAIESSAWDGSWYLRAFFDDGTPLGSAINTECKIDSLAQSWSVLSGAGDRDRSVKAMQSLENYLVMENEGVVKLLTPPFDSGNSNPGYIKGYLPGIRENGGQYTHAAAWTVAAFARLGEGEKAWNLFKLLNPIHHTRTEEGLMTYKTEPYVMAADVYSEYPHVGRGGWTWYTGSAGWMYKAGLENILGIYRQGDKLIFSPSIPGKWLEYCVRYRYHQTIYEIKFKNPNGLQTGVCEIYLNGNLEAENSIALMDDGFTHDVEVLMNGALQT